MYDNKETAKFKSRVRCCQESLNGGLKEYAILHVTYRHGLENHKYALRTIIVVLQIAIDNGEKLFEA